MTPQATPRDLGERRQIPRIQLQHDERNPRGKVRPDDPKVIEMAASMRLHGQIETMVVRPIEGTADFKIVIGHRRDVALGLADIDTADCIVRAMTDEQAFEVMSVENGHREDVPPLGEARAFDLIVQTTGSVQAAALRVSREVSYVRDRLSLLTLDTVVQGRLQAGKLPLEHALTIARFPPALHVEAANAIELDDGSVMSLREATHLLRTKFTLRLEQAPFDRGDGDLYPDAGPCLTCPKRTGSQGELFAAAATADTCLDAKCFGEKRERAWTARAGDHEVRKLPVYEGKKAREVLEEARYLDLEAPCPHDASQRPWKAVLGPKAVKKLPTVLARDVDLNVHELADRTDVAGVKLDERARSLFDLEQKSAQEKIDRELSEQEREARRDKTVKQAIERIVAEVESGPMSEELARSIAVATIEASWPEVLKMVAARMGIPKGPETQAELVNVTWSLPTLSALALVVELVLTRVGTKGEDPLGAGSTLARVLAACQAASKKAKAPKVDPPAPDALKGPPAAKKGKTKEPAKKAPTKDAPKKGKAK